MPANQAQTVSDKSSILCYYLNSTQKIQILRVNSNDDCSLEKIVFPQQRFLFKAQPQAQLEIYIDQKGQKVLQETSLCQSRQAFAQKLTADSCGMAV